MSTYEKIISVVIISLIIIMIGFSFREFTESQNYEHEKKEYSNFDKSFGQYLEMGQFQTIESRHVSGGQEKDCNVLRPVILSVLHNIKERLDESDETVSADAENVFEVNEDTLQLFCNKNANITLIDQNGRRLVLTKEPFTREIPAGGTSEDSGTRVRINATIFPREGMHSAKLTTYGSILIPDRFLDTETNTGL